MPTRRCPDCQAINPADAEECSLCRHGLAVVEVEPSAQETAIHYVQATDTAPLETAGRRNLARAPAPGVRFVRVRPAALVVRAAGLGALTGGGLLLVAGLAAFFPYLGALVGLVLMPFGGARSLGYCLVTGALVGALVGVVVALSRSTAAGIAVAVALAMGLTVRIVIKAWAGPVYDPVGAMVYSVFLVAAAGAMAFFYGYLISLTVHRFLETTEDSAVEE